MFPTMKSQTNNLIYQDFEVSICEFAAKSVQIVLFEARSL